MPAAQRSRNLADSLPATLSEPGSGSMLLSGREENRHLAGGNGAGLRPAVEEACGSSVPAPSAAGARPYERDQAVGQRRRLSCPTRRSSSATRWRRAAFSVRSRVTLAAVSSGRVRRQRAMRQRGEQTCCGRRPIRGRPQTAHRPSLAAYVRLQARRQARGQGETLAGGRARDQPRVSAMPHARKRTERDTKGISVPSPC
jgi:hypothetical protein